MNTLSRASLGLALSLMPGALVWPAPEGCADETGVLAKSAFVIVTEPRAGATVESGFDVRGCSRTFESSLSWRLTARDGKELASGVASGGGADGPGPFRFSVSFASGEAQLGHLEVAEVDASEGEGFPPGRTVLPLVLRGTKPGAAAPPAADVLVGAEPPTPEQLANATYAGIYAQPIQLNAGRYEGAPAVAGGAARPTVQLVPGLIVFGPLDGAPGAEAAVVLSESSGGSGTRLHLAAVGMREGEPVNLGTVLIGDRPQVRSIGIRDGWIRVELVEQGAQDAACCPGQLATRYWGLQDNRLVQVAAEATGRLSLAILEGTEWKLKRLDGNETVPPNVEITLDFSGDRIAGKSACNRYFAQVEEGAAGDLSLGPLGSTKMACVGKAMEIEQRYLARLQKVTRYGFLAGDLVLTSLVDGRVVSLTYARR